MPEGAEHRKCEYGGSPGRVSGAAPSAADSGPTLGVLPSPPPPAALPSTLGARAWPALPGRSPAGDLSSATFPGTLPCPSTLRTGRPRPTSLAAPSPETTSASLGPTVWQLPMAPAGRRAPRDPDSSWHPALRTRPHRGPRPGSPATPSGRPSACQRPSAVAAPPEVWRRRAGPAR